LKEHNLMSSRCPNCGTTLVAGSVSCPVCGRAVAGGAPARRDGGSSHQPIIIVIAVAISLGLVLLVGAAGVLVYYYKRQSNLETRVPRKPEKVGYIDKTGRFVIAPKFEDAIHFSEGLAPVVVDEDRH
jgi:WG containing repeat/zinc-ribbon domain